MKARHLAIGTFVLACALFTSAPPAHAALTLTAGNSATTTPNVATAITGFQIVGPAASTTPVQLRATSGTLSMTSTSGLTFDGASSGSTVNFSGTVANINAALATLRYTRNSTGSDTLEVSLINKGEIFFITNNHLYKFIAGSFNWTNAKAAAEAQTAYGSTGYLVTITSEEENEFVSDRLAGDGWIGATDSGAEGTWTWTTGPEAGTAFWQGTGGGSAIGGRYEAWASNEPNQSGEEDCAETYVSSGTWNDFPCSATLGYVVEFGAAGNMPTVVATNISIVTADVPAITTLTPANAATGISPSANLSIGFSKAVTKNAGSILIRKYEDDSVVETIDAAGPRVTAAASATATIDPVSDLGEGTRYYITMPGSAFVDGSANPFDGISGKTTWAFTTADTTAPSISDVAAVAATTTATVTWTTNELASSRLAYGPTSAYGSLTSVTDTSPRVASHSRNLSGLLSCTDYHYATVSTDAFGNAATSTDRQFLTSGCLLSTPPSSSYSASVPSNTTASTTLTDSGRTLIVTTPANFTATSSSVVIQIKAVDSEATLAVTGLPAPDLESAAAAAFEVTALIDSTTVLDSFDAPVTISYQYTDEDVEGLVESTLRMYHYHSGAWLALDDCTLDAAANAISCDAPNFSTFAIFGTLIPGQASNSSSRSRGTSVTARVNNLLAVGNEAEAESLKAQWPNLFPQHGVSAAVTVDTGMIRDLELGMTGNDVRSLQVLLNANGYELATAGVGSRGNETDYFGTLTRSAVAAFQRANRIAPSAGYFGPITRSAMKEKGISGLWW